MAFLLGETSGNGAGAFRSLEEILRHYRDCLPESRIETLILEAGMHFISRTSATAEEDRTRYIRWCVSRVEAEMADARGRSPLSGTRAAGPIPA